MARDNNTFAKRQREILKKRKAADKRARREKRKEETVRAEGDASDGRTADEQ